jgi:hypothetical protein
MIEPTIYTLDDGKTYNIDFEKTKDHISYTTLKRVKFLSYVSSIMMYGLI